MADTTTLFTALTTFFTDHGGDIASKMAASAGYDILKNALNFKGLAGKIKGFFKKDDQAEKFIKEVCNRQIEKSDDPQSMLSSTYHDVTGETEALPDGLLQELKAWFEENKTKIAEVNNVSFKDTTGFNVGVQKAKGNIFNIQGNYNAGNGKNEN